MPLIQFFLYSEVSVLACAVALSWTSLTLLHRAASPELITLIGSATFLFYTLERNLTRPSPEVSIFPQKSDWLKNHLGLNRALLFFSGVLTLGLVSCLSTLGLVSFGLLTLLALGYSIIKLPQTKNDHRPPQGLKRYAWLKSSLMILVWTYMTLLLPALETAGSWGSTRLWLLVAIWSSWVFSNTLLFDLRDLTIDQATGCTTLAAKLGPQKAHLLIDLNLAFQALLLTAYSWRTHETFAVLAMGLTSLSFFACNRYLARVSKAQLPFYLTADLTLVLPALCLALTQLSS